MIIYDNTRRKKLHERLFISAIVSLSMLRNKLVIVLADCVYVFDLTQGFTVELCIKTCANPKGVCAVGTFIDMPIFATLDKDEGVLRLTNNYLENKNEIKAFDDSIQYLAISFNVAQIVNCRENWWQPWKTQDGI